MENVCVHVFSGRSVRRNLQCGGRQWPWFDSRGYSQLCVLGTGDQRNSEDVSDYIGVYKAAGGRHQSQWV